MGNFKEHLLFGLLLAVTIYYSFDSHLALSSLEKSIAAILVLIGSVLPDIDHKKSYVFRATLATLSISTATLTFFLVSSDIQIRFAIAVTIFLITYISISMIKMKHRGFTHTITFTLILTATSTVLTRIFLGNPVLGLGLTTGLLSHLLLDRELKFSP